MDVQRDAYKEEANELLEELETSLLELEENPGDQELIDQVFRAMHTIKGSGAMFGFDDIAAFTHQIETVYDLVREGKITVTKPLVDLTLAARDQIKLMVDEEEIDMDEAGGLIDAFKAFLPRQAEPDVRPAPVSPNGPSGIEPEDVTYRIHLRPTPEILSTGANPALLLHEIRDLGECAIVARTDRVPPLRELDPEACRLYWDIILTTSRGIDAIRDVFIFVEDECDLKIEVVDSGVDSGVDAGVDAGGGEEDKPDYKRLGEILVERGDLSAEDLGKVLRSRKLMGEMLVDAHVVEPGAVASALVEQRHIQQKRGKRKETVASSIRVPAQKLDALMDLVGELVTVQARLSQKAASRTDSELLAISEEVEHLTAELRDNTMSVRMIPIGATFTRFRRLVRDLSGSLGKKIALLTEGAETELDKTVIDRLNDPMVHIIRNSIDHGVETPEIRAASGKPEQGVIRLSAEHSGANVLIRVSDDGAGLDKKAILHKATAKGLVTTEEADALLAGGAETSDKEIFSLIFAPGFSTAAEVTDVSGRGVGMDVVKRGIEALGGAIDIHSVMGEGSTITLKLPLTLAIIDGLLVRIGQADYVFPLSAVEECVELTREEADRARKRGMMELRGRMISYLSLREFLVIEGRPAEFEKVVIVEANDRQVGFSVDVVVGQHQTVIKSIGDIYKDVKCISGGAIKGDGSVALILDVNMLLQTSGRSRLAGE